MKSEDLSFRVRNALEMRVPESIFLCPYCRFVGPERPDNGGEPFPCWFHCCGERNKAADCVSNIPKLFHFSFPRGLITIDPGGPWGAQCANPGRGHIGVSGLAAPVSIAGNLGVAVDFGVAVDLGRVVDPGFVENLGLTVDFSFTKDQGRVKYFGMA